MLKFALLTFVSFGVWLAALPETWVAGESTATRQPAVQSEPDVTFVTSVVNGMTVVTPHVAGEPRSRSLPVEPSIRTDLPPDSI
jgi:FlaG/FlaF family flagellin (archaellin)